MFIVLQRKWERCIRFFSLLLSIFWRFLRKIKIIKSFNSSRMARFKRIDSTQKPNGLLSIQIAFKDNGLVSIFVKMEFDVKKLKVFVLICRQSDAFESKCSSIINVL